MKNEDSYSIKQLCSSCTHQSCCTGFDSPVVFPEELEKLEKIGKASGKYLEDVIIAGKALKQIQKNQDRTCVFWNDGCQIYDSRPLDCRLFPFDVALIDDEFYWIVYSCNKNSDWQWTEDHLKRFENDPLLCQRKDYVEVFASGPFMELDLPYAVLRKVRFE